MKTKKRKVRITEKDILFLNYLFAMKVTTYNRANRDIYCNYTNIGVANRLRKLESIGLIRGGIYRTVEGGVKAISITKKAFNRFIKSGDEYRVELKSDSLNHDLFLSDLRNSMMHTGRIKEFLTENELQTWGKASLSPTIQACVTSNSDAYVRLNLGSTEVEAAIEYEANQKSDGRYQKLIENYYANSSIQNIFYVASSSAIVKKMMAIERTKLGEGEPKFSYCLAQNALRNETLKFIDINGNVFRLSTDKVM